MYRRLGEPLPHQLANTTQVHLVVMQLHLLIDYHAIINIMRYQLSFPIVIPRYQAGYLRVTHPFATHPEKQAPPSAFYLHVLGTPPAFVLSQDQTLIKSLSSHSFLSLTDLLFFHCSVLQPQLQCPAHWFVLFSFQRSLSLNISQATTISVYHSRRLMSTLF